MALHSHFRNVPDCQSHQVILGRAQDKVAADTDLRATTLLERETMKCSILMLAFLVAATIAIAQDTLHVTAVHKATRDDEKTYQTSFNQNIIIGTVGDRRYTFEQLASWGFYHFEVGTDYPVVKATDKTVKVRVMDKNGRESTESLNVITVEEVTK